MIWLEATIIGLSVATTGTFFHWRWLKGEPRKPFSLSRLPLISAKTARGKRVADILTVVCGFIISTIDHHATPAEDRRQPNGNIIGFKCRACINGEPPNDKHELVCFSHLSTQTLARHEEFRKRLAEYGDNNNTASPAAKLLLRDRQIQAINRGLRELNTDQLKEIVDAIKYKLDNDSSVYETLRA